MRGFDEELRRLQQKVERQLETYFTGGGLEEAMRYSLLAGGKRVRPVLCLSFCRAAGGEEDSALEFACALEMLHTYSLIHDDLPCMDDDALRRGKPTCHKVYGECVATLAGDALQAAAFRVLLGARGPWSADPTVPAQAGLALAHAAGELGMCAGQYLDTAADAGPRTERELTEINGKKTGMLLCAACELGVLACAGQRTVDPVCLESARAYAYHLGLAFQIRDDLLDAESTPEKLGKPIGSDERNGKETYASLLGPEACSARVAEETRRARQALERGVWPGGTDFLLELAERLAVREH